MASHLYEKPSHTPAIFGAALFLLRSQKIIKNIQCNKYLYLWSTGFKENEDKMLQPYHEYLQGSRIPQFCKGPFPRLHS